MRVGRNLKDPALNPVNGFLAEWSKALDSSSSLHLEAWVRIPPEPAFWDTSILPFLALGNRTLSKQLKALWRNG